MRVFLLILLMLITGAGGWYLGTQYGFPSGEVSSSNGTTSHASANANSNPVPRTVHGQGKLLPASGLINIYAPPGERISKLTEKKVGEKVTKGEVLFELQSRVLREKDLQLAQARRADALEKSQFEQGQGKFQISSAQLALDEADAADERIDSESQKIQLLEQQLTASQTLLDRLKKIQSNPTTKDLINQTEIDKQQLMVEQLKIQIAQAKIETELGRKSAGRAKLVARNNLETVENTLDNADKITPLKSLDAAVGMAQQAYDLTQIKSPIDATILDTIVPEGDSAANQPVMVLGDISDMVCIAEINDLFLHRINPDQEPPMRARIISNAFEEPLMGTVIAKGIMIGPPSLKDPNPFASVDRRTGKVTIALDDAGGKPELASQYVNLQVEVQIELEPGTWK